MQIKSTIKKTTVSDTENGALYEIELLVNQDGAIRVNCQGVIIVRSETPFDESFKRGKIVTLTVGATAE